MGLLKSKGRVKTTKGRGRLRPYAESASPKVGPVAGQVREHLSPAVGTAREKVTPYAEKVVERGATVAHQAADKVGPVIDEALGRVTPAAEHAAEKARERFNEDLLPKVTAALIALAAAAEPAVEETARRSRATKAALKGELEVPPPKKSHKVRKTMLFLSFGAVIAAVAKKLLSPPEPAWQSTPTSGREYSSSPGTTNARETVQKPATDPSTGPGTAPTPTGTTKPADAAKDQTDTTTATGTGTEPSANGTAKKTSSNQRRSTGANNTKPAGDL